MVHSIQNYWVSELCLSSRILNTRKYILETGSVSVLTWNGRHLLCWVPHREIEVRFLGGIPLYVIKNVKLSLWSS
jgi:hypothetical protein